MLCSICGARLPEAANYCPNCGNRVQRQQPQQQAPESVWRRPDSDAPRSPFIEPPPPEPASAAAPAEPAPPPSREQRGLPLASPFPPWELEAEDDTPEMAAQISIADEIVLSAWQIGALVGLGLGVAGTLLAWVRVTDGLFADSASAWSGDARFRLADWLSSGVPVDAIVIVLLSAIGVFAVFTEMAGARISIRFLVPVIGMLLVVLGALNWLFIDERGAGFPQLDLTIGLGLYVLIGGGIIAAVCGLLDEFQGETSPFRIT